MFTHWLPKWPTSARKYKQNALINSTGVWELLTLIKKVWGTSNQIKSKFKRTLKDFKQWSVVKKLVKYLSCKDFRFISQIFMSSRYLKNWYEWAEWSDKAGIITIRSATGNEKEIYKIFFCAIYHKTDHCKRNVVKK